MALGCWLTILGEAKTGSSLVMGATVVLVLFVNSLQATATRYRMTMAAPIPVFTFMTDLSFVR
jgi:hypothetical protein